MSNNNVITYLTERLEHWAYWYSQGNHAAIGYPPCTLEYRIMTEGTVVRSQGKRALPCNEAAEEMEFLVKEMAEQNNAMALALRCHYFQYGSLRDKAQRIGISHSHFKHYVDMAHQWLAGRLGRKHSHY